MPGHSHPSAPVPVRIAAVLVAAESLALLAYAVLQLSDIGGSQGALAASTGLFFAVYGGGQLLAAWALWHRYGWARGWVLVTQLVQLGLAWSLRADPTTPVAVVLAALAAAVLAATLSPSATAAFRS